MPDKTVFIKAVGDRKSGEKGGKTWELLPFECSDGGRYVVFDKKLFDIIKVGRTIQGEFAGKDNTQLKSIRDFWEGEQKPGTQAPAPAQPPRPATQPVSVPVVNTYEKNNASIETQVAIKEAGECLRSLGFCVPDAIVIGYWTWIAARLGVKYSAPPTVKPEDKEKMQAIVDATYLWDDNTPLDINKVQELAGKIFWTESSLQSYLNNVCKVTCESPELVWGTIELLPKDKQGQLVKKMNELVRNNVKKGVRDVTGNSNPQVG
uniref:Uncharacterized protein n=1 Tax=viral metagenome TaxID=1070528 RepID=A0A6M3LQL8_9ZZZZ